MSLKPCEASVITCDYEDKEKEFACAAEWAMFESPETLWGYARAEGWTLVKDKYYCEHCSTRIGVTIKKKVLN